MTIRHQSMHALKGPRGKLGKLAGHMICCSGAQASRSKIKALIGGIIVSSNGSEGNTPILLSLYVSMLLSELAKVSQISCLGPEYLRGRYR